MSSSINNKNVKAIWGIKCKNYDQERFLIISNIISYVSITHSKYLENFKLNNKKVKSLNKYFDSLIKEIPKRIYLYKKEISVNKIFGIFILFKYFIRHFFRKKLYRPQVIIREFYDEEYSKPLNFLLDPTPKVIYLKGDKFIKSSRLKSEFETANKLIKVCKTFKFNNLLEVGVGDALIPFLFYLLNKDVFYKIRFFGLDLSAQRIFNAEKFFNKINDSESKKNIFFMIGDGTDIIFEDKSFEASFVNGTLIDCKYNFEKILDEMKRVSDYLILREPIYDFQSRLSKLHISKSDYSIISLRILKKYGQIIFLENDKLHELPLKFSTIVLKFF